jgi:hypothetical protein
MHTKRTLNVKFHHIIVQNFFESRWKQCISKLDSKVHRSSSGILTPWYLTIYRHMTSYDVIWRYISVYESIWRVHTHNATISFHTWGYVFDVWICQHTQHTQTACYAGFKRNKNTAQSLQTRLCINLSYHAVYLSQPGISCHPPAKYSNVFFIPLGTFRMLESACMHILYT